MLLSIDLFAERRSLQRPGAKIECERNECIESAVGERHADEPRYGPLCSPDVATQQFITRFLIDPVREPPPLMPPHYVPVADGRPASRADVNGRAEPLEAANEIEPLVGDVAHDQRPRIF